MTVAAGSLNYRATVYRRSVVSGGQATTRGDYAAVSGLTGVHVAMRVVSISAESQGARVQAGQRLDLTFRLCTASLAITVDDLVSVEGIRYQIESIEPPNRQEGIIRMSVKRQSR